MFYLSISATLGAVAAGTVLGWSAPAIPRLKDNEYDFSVSESQASWIGSLATLGGAFACIPIGIVMDIIGRKWAMLSLSVPFVIGWILLVTADNVAMLMVGRFIVGLAGGAFCVTAPTYTTEIAEDSIRGTLGSFFQLMLTVGILFSYAVGSYVSLFIFNLICMVIPIIFAVVFFFMPETPYFLISHNKHDEAVLALKKLRGSHYDAEAECDQIEAKWRATQSEPMTFKQKFSTKPAIKALVICYSLMFFQQFSGINAVLFNTEEIFESSGADISSKISSIIIGVVQVVATLMSTVVVDKLGRKVLLIVSGALMGICGIALGVFFNIKKDGSNPQLVADISWLPLVSLCIFIVAFSLGFGPIPWMLSGDLCTPAIKATVSSTAGTFNWILAFIITTVFADMRSSMGDDGAFWFFAGISLVGVPLVYLFIPETKGKSIDEIQLILGGDSPAVQKK